MKTIIAGSRTITNIDIDAIIKASGFKITEVVSGVCRGVDELGEQWAKRNRIPVKRFPADWNAHGKAAGPIRNEEMANYADALIAIRAGGKSRGTDGMISEAQAKGLKVFVYKLYSTQEEISGLMVKMVKRMVSTDQMEISWNNIPQK